MFLHESRQEDLDMITIAARIHSDGAKEIGEALRELILSKVHSITSPGDHASNGLILRYFLLSMRLRRLKVLLKVL